MKVHKFLISIILYIFLAASAKHESYAVTTPSFPACTNPQGDIKANHTSGTHGVVGNSLEYKGSDTVYQLTNETLSQCLCTEDGNGTQTNWWKVSSLTEDEIKILKNQGWYYVPNGALWGLENAAYMAINSIYECKGGGSGNVLGASTNVLGLATTGNMRIIAWTALLGLLTLGIGLFFHFYPAQNISTRNRVYIWKMKKNSVLNNSLKRINFQVLKNPLW